MRRRDSRAVDEPRVLFLAFRVHYQWSTTMKGLREEGQRGRESKGRIIIPLPTSRSVGFSSVWRNSSRADGPGLPKARRGKIREKESYTRERTGLRFVLEDRGEPPLERVRQGKEEPRGKCERRECVTPFRRPPSI